MSESLHKALRLPFGLVFLALVCWFVADFPILRLPLAGGFAAYAIALWRYPKLWLIAVPALLPIFDLAPWSGRFFFDEFDALVVLTLGILALRDRDEAPVSISDAFATVLALLAASYFLGVSMRLWRLPPITPDSFANYYSPYNSLRVAKGFVWALLLLAPLKRAIQKNSDAKFLLCAGLLIGLVGVALVSLYERFMFPGLFAWNTEYRISATFSSMHTGDGPIDVFLATTIPLLGVLLVDGRRLALLPLTIGAGLLSLYALVATSSRGPVLAVVIAFAIGTLALSAAQKRRGRVIGAAVLSLSGLVLLATFGLPILAQTSLGQRFAFAQEDAQFRYGHWRAALDLREDSVIAKLFGMGLGSYPLLHQQRATSEPRAARYSFIADGNDSFLRLWSGADLYMGETIGIQPNSEYRFSMKVRTGEPNASLSVAWCELWMMTSYDCAQTGFELQGNSGRWETLSRTLQSGQTGSARSLLGLQISPPARFAFSVSNAASVGVDVDDVSLTDREGHEFIQNSDFTRGADHWFWAVDSDLPWHTMNLAVYVLIEQGWLGLIALGALLALVFKSLATQIAEGESLSAVLLAALTGFMVTVVTVGTLDQPRLALMFYLLCFMSIYRTTPVTLSNGRF